MTNDARADAAIIEFPLRGTWKAFHIPGHHPNAFDFVGLASERRRYFRRHGVRNLIYGGSARDWSGWDQPVVAPCDGQVLAAGDGWPDRQAVGFAWDFVQLLALRRTPSPTTEDTRSVAGNYVLIRMGSGTTSAFLCHLRCGSIEIRTGDTVTTGQAIGRVGNSGNSLAPHLHVNLFEDCPDALTGPDLLRRVGQGPVPPFRLRAYERWTGSTWVRESHTTPRKGVVIRSVSADGPIRAGAAS